MNNPGAARGTVRAKVCIDLLAGRVEPRGGEEPGELRVIPRVEQLRAELQKPSFRKERNLLAEVNVPVVDARAAQDVYAGIAESRRSGRAKASMLKLRKKVRSLLGSEATPTTLMRALSLDPVFKRALRKPPLGRVE